MQHQKPLPSSAVGVDLVAPRLVLSAAGGDPLIQCGGTVSAGNARALWAPVTAGSNTHGDWRGRRGNPACFVLQRLDQPILWIHGWICFRVRGYQMEHTEASS